MICLFVDLDMRFINHYLLFTYFFVIASRVSGEAILSLRVLG